MTQQRFHNLARRILAHENAAAGPVARVYWGKHFTRLISLVRNHNLGII